MFLLPTNLANFRSAPEPIESISVPINACRASKLLGELERPGPGGKARKPSSGLVEGTAWADDLKGVIWFKGTANQLAEDRQRVGEFNVRPRTLKMTVSIDSPLDRRQYSVTGTVFNNEPWTTGDQYSTGVQLTLNARVNEDNTATILAIYRRDKERPITITFRANNASETAITPLIRAKESKKPKLPEPDIRVQAVLAD